MDQLPKLTLKDSKSLCMNFQRIFNVDIADRWGFGERSLKRKPTLFQMCPKHGSGGGGVRWCEIDLKENFRLLYRTDYDILTLSKFELHINLVLICFI
jgi:hypothetical protein